MAVTITSDNFEEKTGSGVALLDFWAPWCGPCRMLTPVIDELAEELGDKAVIGKVNCDDEPELSQKFNVRSIPALFILKDGEVVEQFVGVKQKDELRAALNNAMG